MTELDVLAFITLVVLLFSLYQLAAIWLNVREIRRLRDIKCHTLTQLDFGIARHHLLTLVAEEKLASDSITFLFFYMLNTGVMRRPDRYKEIAKMMRESLLTENSGKDTEVIKALSTESRNWTPQIEEMVDLNISAMDSLMVKHSPVLRLFYTIAKFGFPIVKKHIKRKLGFLDAITHLIGKVDSAMNSLVKSKEELQQLKNCHS